MIMVEEPAGKEIALFCSVISYSGALESVALTAGQVTETSVLSSFLTVTVGATDSPFFESVAVAEVSEPVAPVQV